MCSRGKNTHALKLCNQHCRKWDWSFWKFGSFSKECTRISTITLIWAVIAMLNQCWTVNPWHRLWVAWSHWRARKHLDSRFTALALCSFFFQGDHSSDSARRYCKRQCVGFRVRQKWVWELILSLSVCLWTIFFTSLFESLFN